MVLAKVTPHLPASAPVVKPPANLQTALVQLNLAAAKLLASFLPVRQGSQQEEEQWGVSHHSQEEEEEQGWRGRLLDYYIGVMEKGQVLPSR